MADITTPTNTLAIRPDRMAMLTEKDRVPDRLDRLERAARDGLLGGGGGAVGSEIAWNATNQGVADATAGANTWKRIPIPTAYTKTGDAAAFTANADGTLTVRDAGIYTCQIGVLWGIAAGSRRVVRFGTGTSEAGTPLASDERTAAASPNNPFATITFTGYLAAGTVLCVMTFADTATLSRQVYYFNIARGGAGPAGPQGPQGATGPTPDITVTAQALGVDPPANADADVTESPANQFNFAFLIPKGVKGDTGAQGAQGVQGPTAYVAQPGTPGSTNVIWVDTDEPDPDPLAVEAVHLLGAAGEPTMPVAWSIYAAGWQAPGFYKDNQGRVFLQGMIKKSSAVVVGEVIFTLPVGYRPLGQSLFVVMSNSAVARIDVMPNGQVQASTGVNAGWVSMAGISFRGEQ
jgi:hypothetical protein